ncbi:hypothetical protein Dsin_017151 [Dipteronia sinensis]|uniref:Reverse transcriptase domain-containing protein n=1 Tax=Dipteronia sinensis TaxID=43782 RepID=A0AAE0AEG0_9ROSI|nr:hypothetical protein Dsin_017151 [Dipteronia sinensis]
MMRKLGFSELWINLITGCISSVSYSFVLNGEICGSIKPTHGLRQGDPLSPYLFLLSAEGLSCLVNQAVRNKEITGFKCSSTWPIISHLLFVDDSLLFAEATPSNCVSIHRILDCYTKASGQEVNYTKSAMCVSLSLTSQVSAHLAAIVGVRAVECHEKYLGLPCFTGRHKRKVFTDISKRVWDKIKGWRDKFLSAGGKEVFIKAVIQSIPSYTMSLFKLPKNLVNEIYRLSARF